MFRRCFSTTVSRLTVSEVTSLQEFRTKIGNNTSVVDFYATWCGPCKAISPIVEKMSDLYTQHNFYKVDVDNASDIAMEYGISAMPTFLLFKDGEKVATVVGANPQGLKSAIDSLE